jgi:hypothetical protein
VPTLPATMIRLLVPFAPLLSKRVWLNAQVLLMGAFAQLRADERSALPCVRWAWTTTKGSIATTGCSEKRQLVEPKGEPCAVRVVGGDVRGPRRSKHCLR